jgi:hypothetical protein
MHSARLLMNLSNRDADCWDFFTILEHRFGCPRFAQLTWGGSISTGRCIICDEVTGGRERIARKFMIISLDTESPFC